MQQREQEKKIGGKAMPFRDGPFPSAITKLGEVHEIEEMIAPHEGVDDAEAIAISRST